MNFSNEFKNGETLLRGIHIKPDFWNSEKNRPSSAAFKDSRGLSVNRTGENKKYYKESLECLKNNLGERLKAAAEINADFCLDLGLFLKYCPMSDNIYHSEIHKSENEPLLTKSTAKKLSEACKLICR
jgi:hypothetical protein